MRPVVVVLDCRIEPCTSSPGVCQGDYPLDAEVDLQTTSPGTCQGAWRSGSSGRSVPEVPEPQVQAPQRDRRLRLYAGFGKNPVNLRSNCLRDLFGVKSLFIYAA